VKISITPTRDVTQKWRLRLCEAGNPQALRWGLLVCLGVWCSFPLCSNQPKYVLVPRNSCKPAPKANCADHVAQQRRTRRHHFACLLSMSPASGRQYEAAPVPIAVGRAACLAYSSLEVNTCSTSKFKFPPPPPESRKRIYLDTYQYDKEITCSATSSEYVLACRDTGVSKNCVFVATTYKSTLRRCLVSCGFGKRRSV